MGLNSSYSCWKNLRNIDILLPHYKSPIRHSANTLVHNHNTYYTTKFLQSGTPGKVELEKSGPKATDLPVVTSGVNTDFVHLSCYPDFIESTQPSKRLQKIQRWVNKVLLETDNFKNSSKTWNNQGACKCRRDVTACHNFVSWTTYDITKQEDQYMCIKWKWEGLFQVRNTLEEPKLVQLDEVLCKLFTAMHSNRKTVSGPMINVTAKFLW